MSNQRKICPNPWTMANFNTNGKMTPCVQIASLSSAQQNKLRKDMLVGLTNPNCDTCTKYEGDNLLSQRQINVSKFGNVDFLYKRTYFNGGVQFSPISISIDFSTNNNLSSRIHTDLPNSAQRSEFQNIVEKDPSFSMFIGTGNLSTSDSSSNFTFDLNIEELIEKYPSFFINLRDVEIIISGVENIQQIQSTLAKLMKHNSNKANTLIVTTNFDEKALDLSSIKNLFEVVNYKFIMDSLHPNQSYVTKNFLQPKYLENQDSWMKVISPTNDLEYLLPVNIYNITYLAECFIEFKKQITRYPFYLKSKITLSFNNDNHVFSPLKITPDMKKSVLMSLTEMKRSESSQIIINLINTSIRTIKTSPIYFDRDAIAIFKIYNSYIDNFRDTKLSHLIIKESDDFCSDDFLKKNKERIISKTINISAKLMHAQENFNQLNNIISLTELDSVEIDTLRKIGIKLYEDGKKIESLEYFKKVLASNPHDTFEIKRVAWLYLDLNELDKSFELFMEILKIDSTEEDTVKTLNLGGWNTLSPRNLDKLISYYLDQINKGHIKNHAALKALGWIYMDGTDDNLTFATFIEALSISPNDQEVIDALCSITWKNLTDKNIIKLIEFYEALINKNSSNILALNALDWILQLTGRIQSSDSLFESILQIKTNDTNSLYIIAKNHVGINSQDKAILVIKKIYEIDKSHKKTEELLSHTNWMNLNTESGTFLLEMFRKKYFSNKQDSKSLINYVYQYHKLNNLGGSSIQQDTLNNALKFYLNLLETHEHNIDLLKILGWLYKSNKQYKKSLYYFKKVITISPDDKFATDEVRRLTKGFLIKVIDKIKGIIKATNE